VEKFNVFSSQVSASTTVPNFLAAAEHLIGPVDAFFDNVFVMADDEGVRRNRLALLRCSKLQSRRPSNACAWKVLVRTFSHPSVSNTALLCYAGLLQNCREAFAICRSFQDSRSTVQAFDFGGVFHPGLEQHHEARRSHVSWAALDLRVLLQH